MEITDIRIRRLEGNNKMKAIVSITIDDEFVLHDIKVVDGEKGLFIAMPSKKTADGEYRDIAHPINSGTREKIQTIILKQYEQAMAEAEAEEVAAEAWAKRKKECPGVKNGSGYVFRPGAFLSVKTKMTIYKSISPSFYEGGDSELFINYLRFIIKGICKQSVSKF